MEQIVGNLIQPKNNDKTHSQQKQSYNSNKSMTTSYSMLSNTAIKAFVQGKACYFNLNVIYFVVLGRMYCILSYF